MHKYLSPQQVVRLHIQAINNYGGSHGIRSQGLLESAVFRMQASFGGEDLYPTIFEKAAALLESLCRNHPFIDGNKRTSFIAAVTFLDINGYETTFNKDEGEREMISVAEGKSKLEHIAEFLKKASKKRK